MKLGDFISALAAKAGVAKDAKELVAFLSCSEIANADVADSLTSSIDAGLLNLDAAKQNPVVKSYFTASALNGVDAELMKAVEELGLGDDTAEEFKSETNTHAKLRSLISKAKAAQAAGAKGDSAKYAAEIAGLNKKLSEASDAHKAELDALMAKNAEALLGFKIDTLLAGKPYANKDLPADVNVTVAKTLLKAAMDQKGIKVVDAPNGLALKRADDPTLDYLENHKPVAFDTLVDSVLSGNKLLAVSSPNNGGNGGAQSAAIIGSGNGSLKIVGSSEQQLSELDNQINAFN